MKGYGGCGHPPAAKGGRHHAVLTRTRCPRRVQRRLDLISVAGPVLAAPRLPPFPLPHPPPPPACISRYMRMAAASLAVKVVATLSARWAQYGRRSRAVDRARIRKRCLAAAASQPLAGAPSPPASPPAATSVDQPPGRIGDMDFTTLSASVAELQALIPAR